ncbi:hypothetical protein JW887_04710 [Candidatus Dojkabacteria bacterium]|nr:hypothetical protein [Candidatus Dojkabacteria bacterium]
MSELLKKTKSSQTLIVSITVFVILVLSVAAVAIFFKISNGFSNNSLCDSESEFIANDKDDVSISCGDTVILTVVYKGSTGYSPFDPQYDTSVFELVDVEDNDDNNGLVGGDNTIRTYTFKSINQSDGSVLQVGIFQSWDALNTMEIQQEVKVIVR